MNTSVGRWLVLRVPPSWLAPISMGMPPCPPQRPVRGSSWLAREYRTGRYMVEKTAVLRTPAGGHRRPAGTAEPWEIDPIARPLPHWRERSGDALRRH